MFNSTTRKTSLESETRVFFFNPPFLTRSQQGLRNFKKKKPKKSREIKKTFGWIESKLPHIYNQKEMLIYGKPTNQKLNHSISPQRCALDPGWKPTTKANTTKKLLATRKTWRRKRRIQHEKKKKTVSRRERNNAKGEIRPSRKNHTKLTDQSWKANPPPLFLIWKKFRKIILGTSNDAFSQC